MSDVAVRPRRAEVVSWCLYDFANSAYSAVIVATVFSVYYASEIVGEGGDAWWGRAISLSMLIVALTSPILGGLGDRAGLRKELWIVYTLLAVLSVASFSLLAPGMVMTGFLLIVLANIGMEGALVFYNSYLPLIAGPDYQGRVSGWGFATGYLGSITALLAAILLSDPFRPRAIWLLVATQFLLFSLPAWWVLPNDPATRTRLAVAAREGLRETFSNLRDLWRNRPARRFLAAYVFYEDGVNTVIVFASIFAAQTLGFGRVELISLFLLVQLSALCGAWVMAKPTDILGPKPVIVGALILWCAVSVAAFFVATKIGFWFVAAAAGLGLGTVQAASRAMYSSFIPPGREAKYFGVYAMVGKSAAVMGPILFGEVSRAFGSQRPAILSVASLFLVGLALLMGVRGRAH